MQAQVSVALLHAVVAQQRAEYEILLGCEQVEGFVAETLYHLHAILVAEKYVYFVDRHFANQIMRASALQLSFGFFAVFGRQGVQNQFPQSFFVFVYVMCKNPHVLIFFLTTKLAVL